jgi:uracil-DNA glycosylase
MSIQKLIKIYTEVCECTSENCKTFPEIYKSLQNGSPPRGFYTRAEGPVDVLVVGKNPGHILDSEAAIYKNLRGEELVKAHWDFSRDTFYKLNQLSSKEKRSTTFHSNLLSYLAEILSVNREIIFENAAYTNLVKCSNAGNEQVKLSIRSMNECLHNHLIREINFFKPKLIFALGREVEIYLKRKKLDGVCPIVYIKHPSYHYKKEEKDKKVSDLRSEYLKAIDAM